MSVPTSDRPRRGALRHTVASAVASAAARAVAGLLALVMGGVVAAQPSPVRASSDPVPAAALAPGPAASAPGVAAVANDSASAAPAAAPASAPDGSLDARIQQVKAEVLRLNRDLLVLEEELLFPASTQVAVFVSMDVGVLFELSSVQVLLDGQVVANHLYTAQEHKALQRGGVQRLFLGNLKTGKHELVAFFTGQGPHARDYKRGATVEFDKDQQPRYVELQIRDRQQKLQPEFEVKVWP